MDGERVCCENSCGAHKSPVFFGNLPPCVIGMEACASAHHWARTLQRFGHTVRLIAPQFVKPYVKTNKNDVADAEAICEAVGRPNMRFVPIKSIEQQAILSVHRVRQGFVKARTAQANQIRGLLGEFGLVIPQGIINVAKRVPEILEDASNELPVPFRHLIDRLTTQGLDVNFRLQSGGYQKKLPVLRPARRACSCISSALWRMSSRNFCSSLRYFSCCDESVSAARSRTRRS
jgi:hypothetical protein